MIDTLILGWVGANPPEGIMIVIGRLATAYYFLHFIAIMPLVGFLERPRSLPPSIHHAVLESSGRQAAPEAAE